MIILHNYMTVMGQRKWAKYVLIHKLSYYFAKNGLKSKNVKTFYKCIRELKVYVCGMDSFDHDVTPL